MKETAGRRSFLLGMRRCTTVFFVHTDAKTKAGSFNPLLVGATQVNRIVAPLIFAILLLPDS
jgi:hypothetical protein